MKNYVILIGTGRCGLNSLHYLINSCKNCSIANKVDELDGIISWKFNKRELNKTIDLLSSKDSELVGVTGFYYINFIIPLFTKFKDNLKVVCIYRNKEEVVKSYLINTEYDRLKINLNHWQNNKYVNNEWSKCYPTYSNLSKEKAIKKYYEVYKGKVITLKNLYKDNIFILNVKDLNSKDKQKELFSFLNIKKQDRVYQTIRLNKGVRL